MVPEGGGDVAVPPTIQALLAARLDQLDPAERSVLESGAVEGQVFHRGAVAALAPEERAVDGKLITLVRKDLVRPEASVVADDEAYRFRHLLIRDTAYEALSKATRAELHERFATWLAEHGAELVELDEIVGYHLEQAYRYRVELGPLDDAAAEIGARAGDRLLASAGKARDRGDTVAAQALLTRAVDLVPAGSGVRAGAVLQLAVIHAEPVTSQRAAALREETVALATSTQDEGLLARVTLARVEAEVQYDANVTMRGALAQAEEALAVLERLEDEEGAIWGLRLVGQFRAWLGSGAAAEALWGQACERAERFSPRLTSELLIWRCWDVWWGATPADEGVRLCNEWMASSPSKRLEAIALLIRGTQKAALKQIEDGRADVAAGRELLHDLGDMIWWAGSSMISAEMELLAGNAQGAYETLALGRERLGGELRDRLPGDGGGATGSGRARAGARRRSAPARGRDGAGGRRGRLRAALRHQLVRARVLARRGESDQADELLREAAALIEPTDYVIMHLGVAFARAEVDRLAGRTEAERKVLEAARPIAEKKRDLVAVDRMRARLAEIS